MKKSLLLLASLAVSAASYADWTKPVPQTVDNYQLSTFAEEGGDTIVYYLYNKDAKAFFTEGNAWGTQASIGEQGLKVAITKYLPDEDGAQWDGKTVLINDFSIAKNAWKLLFIDSETGSFVDRGTQPNYMWEISPLASAAGLFHIKGAEVNPTYNQGYLFGLDGNAIENNSTVLAPYIDPAEDLQAQVVWQFVNEEAYVAYQEVIPTYLKAMELKGLIELAKEKGVSSADAEKVYANENSTIEALTEACEALNQTIKDAEFGAASEDNPLDVTEWIKNPNFDSNADGWTNTFKSGENATNVGHQGANYQNGEVRIASFIEAWANTAFSTAISGRALGVGELSQTISNMPQGKYKFTCDAIANNQDGVTPVNGVQLFAKGGDLDVYQKMATGNGQPEHFELTFVNDGDELTIGLRTTEECNANWIAADNFTLTYYGPTTEDPEKINMDQVVEKALEEISLDDIEAEDFYAAAADIEAYKEAVEAAQNASSDYTACGDAVTTALSSLKASRTAYAAYVKEVERVRDFLNNHELADCDEKNLVSDYTVDGNDEGPSSEYENGTADYILSNKQLDATEIAAETTKLSEMLKHAIAAGIYEGMDCTDMLVNADFTAGNSTGWTVNINPTNFAWTGGFVNVPVCESWHSKFDISQEVSGVPDGIYAISLNGFCRLDDGVDVDVPAEVYLNEFATPLMNLNEDPISAGEAVDGVNAYLSTGETGAWTQNPIFQDENGNPCKHSSPADNIDSEFDGGYIPNGMEGASVAFSAGRYKATAYGLVEGGTIKIGVRNTKSTNVWALWGNFRLTYMGKDAAALENLLPIFVERLNNYVEEYGDVMTEPAQADATKATDAAEKAADAEEMYAALINVNNAITAAHENVEAVQNFDNAVIELGIALEENPDADQKYYNEIADQLDATPLTTAEVIALTAKIYDVAARLAIPDGSAASDDNPLDFTSVIKNADFEQNSATQQATGWTLVKGEGAQGNYQVQNGYDGGVSMEFWSNTNGSGTQFDFFQTLKFLPAGTYELTVEASNSLNGQEAGPGDGSANIYVSVNGNEQLAQISVQEVGCTDDRNTYTILFNVSEGDEVVVGAKNVGELSARWVMIDNFRLTYYGAGSANAIANVGAATAATAIYSTTGVRANTLQKGINIVKMSNGTVQKVLVK